MMDANRAENGGNPYRPLVTDDRLRWSYALDEEFVATAELFFPGMGPTLVNYMLHCSPSRRFLYVETPKVASSTIKRALQANELDGDLELLNRYGGNMHDRNHSPIPPISHSGLSLRDVLTGPGYYRFAFVRNPYTRAVSAYLNKIADDEGSRSPRLQLGFGDDHRPTFLAYLEALITSGHLNKNTHWMPQATLLSISRISYDFIGRFERLADDWAIVAARLGLDVQSVNELRFDSHRTNGGRRAKDLIGPREEQLIAEIYAMDFDAFGYERGFDSNRE